MSSTTNSAYLSRSTPMEGTRQKPGMMLAIMLLAVFMSVANVFIVNVATPSIQKGLQAGFSGIQFVVSGYTLAFAVALIIGSRLGDRFGRKRMLLLGVAGFTLASLLCGLSASVNMLILARVLQGLCAALISPQILSLIQVNYPPGKRGAVFGLYGAAQGLAASTGQVIGGLLLQLNLWNLDWRMVFFFSVPIGVLIMLMIPFLAESKSEESSGMDGFGALLVAAGLFMFVYPLVQGPKSGWPLPLQASLILSIPVLAAFVWFELRLLRRQQTPFMNVRLFGQRMFATGMLVVFLLMCTQAAFFLVTAYFLQIGLGFTALKAGTLFVPMGMGYFLASLLSSKISAKLGAHVLTLGVSLTVAGYMALALSVHASGLASAGYEWIPALAVLGLGQGFIASPITNIVLSKIRSADVGSASGILTTGMQVAFAIGIALIGILWLNTLDRHADSVSHQVEQQLRQSLSASTIHAEQDDEALQTFRDCYPLLAKAGNASAVPVSCQTNTSQSAEKSLYAGAVRTATAQNYADSYLLSLYVLAAAAACMLPLVLMLALKRRSGADNPQP